MTDDRWIIVIDSHHDDAWHACSPCPGAHQERASGTSKKLEANKA